MMRFQDQVVVVTGAGRGIGYALAERFAAEGAKVVIAEKDAETGTAAAQKLNATFEQLDVSQSAQVEQVVNAIVNRFGRIDVWVNNAGIAHKALAIDLPPADWDAEIGVMLSGAFYCAHYAGAIMLKQGSGSMVNISSVNGIQAQKARAPYSAAKAGLIMLTKVLASEWAEHGVRVNAVAPGVFMTELAKQRDPQTYLSRIPMGRMGELNEVVEAITFLASDEASFVTGEVLRVDGGWAAYHLFYPFEKAF